MEAVLRDPVLYTDMMEEVLWKNVTGSLKRPNEEAVLLDYSALLYLKKSWRSCSLATVMCGSGTLAAQKSKTEQKAASPPLIMAVMHMEAYWHKRLCGTLLG